MAPTVCMTDKPILATDAPCLRRKSWQDKAIIYRHSIGLRQLSMKNSNCETNYHQSFLQGAKIPGEQTERLRLIMKRRKGLLEIVARTIALVRRNHLLQKRVDALRLETQDFLQSVLKNSGKNNENDGKLNAEVVVSSSTDNMEIDNTRLNGEDEPRINSNNQVTSSCILSDTVSGLSSSDSN